MEMKAKHAAMLMILAAVLGFCFGWLLGFWHEPLNLDNAEDFCWRMGGSFSSWNSREIVCREDLDSGRISYVTYRNPDMKVKGQALESVEAFCARKYPGEENCDSNWEART